MRRTTGSLAGLILSTPNYWPGGGRGRAGMLRALPGSQRPRWLRAGDEGTSRARTGMRSFSKPSSPQNLASFAFLLFGRGSCSGRDAGQSPCRDGDLQRWPREVAGSAVAAPGAAAHAGRAIRIPGARSSLSPGGGVRVRIRVLRRAGIALATNRGVQRILPFGKVRLSVPRALPAPRGMLGDLESGSCHSLILPGLVPLGYAERPPRDLSRDPAPPDRGPVPTCEPAQRLRGDTRTQLGVPVG